MGKHLNPLEKEFLIRKYKSNPRLKMTDFCIANDISISSFPKWLKQYNEGGLEGLARADSKIKDVLPEGIDRTEESRCWRMSSSNCESRTNGLKKNYAVRKTDAGELEYIRLKPKNSKL